MQTKQRARLDEIVSQVDSAADLIDSIALASVEQAQGIEQINLGITQVSQVIQTNAATAQESAAASQELSSQAARLKEHASIFKLRARKNSAASDSTRYSVPASAPAQKTAPVSAAPARKTLGTKNFTR